MSIKSTIGPGLIMLFLSLSANGLIFVGGKEPVTDKNWPAGSLDVANHKSRQSWTEGPPFGGGLWAFQFRGNAGAFNEVLAKFALIKSPDLLLVIHEGAEENPHAAVENKAKDSNRVDWIYTIWTPESFYRLFGNASGIFLSGQPEFRSELPPPRLDVFADARGVDWNLVQLPPGLRVIDERAGSHGYKPEDGSVIAGTAYDMLTGKPVAAVEVSVAKYERKPPKPSGAEGTDADAKGSPNAEGVLGWTEVAAAVGDADGRFELKNIPEGNYQVMLRCVGYSPRVLGYADGKAGHYKSYTVRMSPAVEQVGSVVDDKGKPLAKVKVTVDSTLAFDGRGYPTSRTNENQEVITDAEGRFTLTGLPRGEAGITAWGDHLYQVDMMKVHPIPGPPITLTMTGTGTIRGKVIGRKGPPAEGTVSVWDQAGEVVGTWGGSMNLLEGGSFVFENVPPGKYFITGDPAARFQKNATFTAIEVKPGETVEVELKK